MVGLNTPRSILVTVARPYGKEVVHPECQTARLFAELLGQKTLTVENLKVIQKLGFKIFDVGVGEVFFTKVNEGK